jgi:hypothetical protein
LTKAQTIEHHGFDSFPDGEVAPFWVLLHRLVHHFAKAKFVKHPRDKAKMIQTLDSLRVQTHRNALLGPIVVSSMLSQSLSSWHASADLCHDTALSVWL